MKKQVFRLALLFVTFCVFLCACASSVEEENFDADFLGTSSGVDLNGFELVYGKYPSDDILGYTPDTEFADLALQRLDDIQDRFNCKITFQYGIANVDFLSASVGNAFLCDVFSGGGDLMADAARIGALIGISELSDYIDYRDEAKWGSRKMLEVVYYEDDLYGIVPCAWPALGFSDGGFGYPIAVNEDLVRSLAQPDPREYVENGTWDWAQFRKCLEAYTVIEGGETIHYGIAVGNTYLAEMYLLSNGCNFVKKGPGGWVSDLTDERTMKAMQEANDVFYGELGYTIDKSSRDAGVVADLFVNEKAVMGANMSNFFYGKDARISRNVNNFGILKWPVGPDVDPDYAFSVYEDITNCLSFPVLSHDPDNTAFIINELYAPLPGLETFDAIKEYMAHNYFFDERDCDCFFAMYQNPHYNYFHYGFRGHLVAFFDQHDLSIAGALEKNSNAMQAGIDEYVAPSLRGIEALWGPEGN